MDVLTLGSLDLRTQLEQIQAKQRFLGRLLTKPEKPGRPSPMTCKKYLLRGIATDKDIVYVCQRVPSEPADPESSDAPTDQWWRLELCTDEDLPVKSEVSPPFTSYMRPFITRPKLMLICFVIENRY
jgi:hypothetical protein